MIRIKSGNIFIVVVSVMLLLGFLGSVPLYSQVVGGTISGTVFDPSKAVIPGAELSIKNAVTGVTTTATTNAEGIYNAPNLLPGEYSVTISAAGFQTKAASGVTLAVGAQQVLNITLNLGEVSKTLEVSWNDPDVQLASTTISGVMNTTTVQELPLNGRSWTDLATLQPGVSTIHAMVAVTSTDRLGRGLGSELSITGGRPQQNNYVLNGISINDYSNQAPGSLIGGNLGVDAISEFSILISNYSTEYGRTSGGVISAITRSGTNEFHGSAYEFLRDSALDARNFFDQVTISPFRRNQFGASAAGPIRKEKTFIFGNYEGLRQSLGLSTVDTVPSLNARQGTLCDTTTPDCSKTIQVPVEPAIVPYLKFFPLPNGPLQCARCVAGAGNTALYSFSSSQLTNENYFTTRVDHKLSGGDSLSGSYMFDNAPSSQNDEFNNKLILTRTRRQVIAMEENHVFTPYFLNSFRLGYSRVYAASPAGGSAVNPLAADTSLGFTPGTSVGAIAVVGLTSFTGGLSTTQPQVYNWNSWQGYDNIFLTKGIHSLKFGANIERIEDNSSFSSFPGGNFSFNSLQNFLTNNPASISIDVPGTVTSRGIRETLFGAYVQDDVRFRPNLTFNLGLRYEMATVPTEVHGRLASLHSLTDSAPHLGSPLFANPSLKDFEPRVGFSWDPFHDGRTAIRGGFGMYDVQVLPPTLRHSVDGTVPFAESANGSNLPSGSFPTGAFAFLSAATNTERVAFIEQHPPRNYVIQWNLNVQREIAPNLTAMVAYVGARGVHNIFQSDDTSIVLPLAQTPFGFLWPIPDPTNPLPVLNPNFGRVSATLWDSSSIYHSLEVQVKRRMRHGLQAQVSYTFSKSIDTSSGATDGDQFLNGISSLFFFDHKTRRGLSDFNVSQTLSLNFIWDIPSSKTLSGVLGWATNGWELGGILQANTGVPFTPVIGPDPLGMNNTDPFDLPNYLRGCNPIKGSVDSYLNLNCFTLPVQPAALAGKCVPFTNAPPPPAPPTCANLVGNAGRNSLIGPGLVAFDSSLFKNNPIRRISETFNVQFRMEVFNAFNHANFNPPTANEAIFDGNGAPVPGAGAITSTATTSRQIQIALKVIW
jgi:hypothetical protein